MCFGLTARSRGQLVQKRALQWRQWINVQLWWRCATGHGTQHQMEFVSGLASSYVSSLNPDGAPEKGCKPSTSEAAGSVSVCWLEADTKLKEVRTLCCIREDEKEIGSSLIFLLIDGKGCRVRDTRDILRCTLFHSVFLFSSVYTNAHGLGKKQEELELHVWSQNCSTIGTTGTWWDAHKAELLQWSTQVNCERQPGKTGRAVIYVKELR